MKSCSEIAAIIHADMCNDESNGYDWSTRWGGDGWGWKTLSIDGRDYSYNTGSYDCSSSTITAWKLALQYTDYAGCLDAATYTGNMRSVFVNSGLFEVWDTYSTNAVRGDLYLNDGNHVAMCQYGGQDGTWDSLSEFSGNEWGGVYGGQPGDQTGWESHITGYYSYPWDATLHYNGKADGTSRGDDNRRHNVIMWHSHGKKNQRWKLTKKDGLYVIRNVADKYYLDADGAADEDGTEVILWSEFHGGKNQLWKLDPVSGKNGCYRIVSAMDGARVLDVVNASQDEGASVCIYRRKDTDTANQEWYIMKNSDGTRTIVNNGLGPKMALDASGQA